MGIMWWLFYTVHYCPLKFSFRFDSMMKRLQSIVICALLVGLFAGCQQNKDEEYFNGDLIYLDDDSKIVREVTSKPTDAENFGYGMFAVYDSLAVYWSPKFPEHFFWIFNIDTGKEIGFFCNRGRGPKEMNDIHAVFQFFKKGNDLMTLLYAHNERKIFFWNISQSVITGNTVYDTIIPYDGHVRSIQTNSRFDCLFYQGENRLLAKIASVAERESEASLPYYELRSVVPNELVRDLHIYKKRQIQNKSSEMMPVDFFYSLDVIKPDGSKVVQAMGNLPQINILDTKTGAVVGCRVRENPGFAFFETSMNKRNRYYISVQADDNYIYATYWGKQQWGYDRNGKLPLFNTIHVFDWNGDFICELKTDRSFLRISLDEARNRLYTADPETEKIYYLDLKELSRY